MSDIDLEKERLEVNELSFQLEKVKKNNRISSKNPDERK